jgi:hypothetical protein
MKSRDNENSADGDWDNPEDLDWTEFDWEKYLRSQDDMVHRYLGFYEHSRSVPDRIDEVARLMGWEVSDKEIEKETESEAAEDDEAEAEPYVIQSNPVFIATSALFRMLQVNWERVAGLSSEIPKSLALPMQAALYRSERQSLLAIQSLDMGDFAMAVSLFKRALRDLNVALSHLSDPVFDTAKDFQSLREDMQGGLFDLREIWLRVIAECREEVSRHESGDE